MPLQAKQEAAINIIEPRSGVAFTLQKGQSLTIIDIEGEQVADLICYRADDTREYLSSGRTIDYAETLFITKGHALYSNRSNVMLRITDDEVGRHDFLLTPCSRDTFSIIYGHKDPHHGCHGNLCHALASYDIDSDAIPVTFNIFMHVGINSDTGQIKVLPPKSTAGQSITVMAEMDLIVGLTSCSAPQSNNGSFKPIGYYVS